MPGRWWDEGLPFKLDSGSRPRFNATSRAARRPPLKTMKLARLSEAQKHALIDLLVVGMYADHNLSSAEDACVQRLLDQFKFDSDYHRQQFSDAAFTRSSRHTGSPEAIRGYVAQLAANFTGGKKRQEVYDMLNDLLTSDGRVTTEESQLLGALREAFNL